MMTHLRIGTRNSQLALAQTALAKKELSQLFPEMDFEVVTMTTKADRHLDRTLSSFGGKGVFTKELEEGLISGSIDMAVHSAKDMPAVLPEGLMIGAVLARADVRDVIVTCSGTQLEALPAGAVVGTGSLRRQLQAEAVNPKITVRQIRGNVQTRLDKLAQGQYDAIILAAAGLCRLGADIGQGGYAAADGFDYSRFQYEIMETSQILPAAAQGILAVECRADDEQTKALLAAVNDVRTRRIYEAERSFLIGIGGSCNAPAAALADFEGDRLKIEAMYAPAGSGHIHRVCLWADEAKGDGALGTEAARLLKSMSESGGSI